MTNEIQELFRRVEDLEEQMRVLKKALSVAESEKEELEYHMMELREIKDENP